MRKNKIYKRVTLWESGTKYIKANDVTTSSKISGLNKYRKLYYKILMAVNG